MLLAFVGIAPALDRFDVNGNFNDEPADYDESPVIFNYNEYLQKPHATKVDSKSKVETLGGVLKGHIQELKATTNKEIDLIFLVDSSTSVGKNNFREEVKFVKKLLSDFTVDSNHTRVSVITFSSRDRVIRHVDYFSDEHKDRHKCSLLEEDLKNIDYSGGGTYTLGAFVEAKQVLKNSRDTANKVIFLVTDGFSNGGDPRAQASALRQMGVKIFTFGIQNGNVRELFDMASNPKNESTYILDSFEEFEALAKRALHEDLTNGRYIKQSIEKCSRLCVGQVCCDAMASCNCGTHTGKYECICPPGYFGNGLKGGCQACPSGTYKADETPGDVLTCTKCPDENHITEPGATSVHQCVCRKGYQNFNGNGCAVLKCPALNVPKNGYFVNKKCMDVFNAACGLKCQPGYDLRGSSLRICREDGTWSGTETECIMKTCPTLMVPKNGNMICTTDDFSFNTVCRFTCDTGYKLVGSRKRMCMALSYWDGLNTRCREITCRPLPVVRDGSIYPPACTAGDVAFGTTCSITCHPGYSLVGPHNKQCLPEGVWAPATEISQCVDTSPPFIMCPYNIDAETDLNEDTATVTWQVPLAVDNSGYVPILSSVPAVMPPEKFRIGSTKVTYLAEDLNKNSADCHFYVNVKDKQKPTIDRCFSPLPIVSPEPYAEVTWEEPIFSDNSREDVRIRRSHAPGLFPKGKSDVTYTAYDSSGNNNTCIIKINIIPHPCEYPPTPLNGNRTCYEDSEGVVCMFKCKDSYEFAIKPATEYRCAFDNVWEPREQMPVSDCTALQLSNDIIQPASFTFAGIVACNLRIELTRLEKDFEHRVTKRINELCEEGVNCAIRDLETKCEQAGDSGITIILGRDKRSVIQQPISKIAQQHAFQEKAVLGDGNAIVTFSSVLAGSLKNRTDSDKPLLNQQKLLTTVENIKATLAKDAKRGDFNLMINGRRLELINMLFDEKPTFLCNKGSTAVENSCVKCPAGTFFNVVSKICADCPKGTFQTELGQVSCLYCPTNTSTPNLHATSEESCKHLCLPGTFSENGLEMCETCRKGFYQDQYGQTDCIKCPKYFTTLWRGSMELKQCRGKCEPGYISKTGLQPCWPCPRGSYQPKGGKSSCILCPENSDTAHLASVDPSDCEMVQSDTPGSNDTVKPLDDEQQLIQADDCLENPCSHNGTCKSDGFGFECTCAAGYGGTTCDQEIDECAVNPCLNGGKCVDSLAAYLCRCPDGFTGQKCETNIDDCNNAPCLNNGTCIDEVNNYLCRCINGFEGQKCEINTNDCANNPCMNSGNCTDEIAGYKCACPKGFKGGNCEINDDECASAPCQNGGVCVDGIGNYSCVCVLGFTGSSCQTDIDECASNPCAAGAKCEDLPGGHQCHCRSGFTGKDCKAEIDIYYQMDFSATASVTDYAKVKMPKDLTAATACFWMKTTDDNNQGTPFSYATLEGDNIFTLQDYDGFVFYVNGEKVMTTIKSNDGQWHHICVVWSSNRGSWKIYSDGTPMDSGKNLASGQTIKGGGQFIVGQEQDKLGGGFSSTETFIGQLSQLNVWDRELSLEDIESLRLSCKKNIGDVVSWADLSGTLQGSVKDSPIDFCKDCPVPISIDSGSVKYNGLSAGSAAEYTCERGFQLTGRNEFLCLVTGEWEGNAPSCARIQCGHPGQISNGWIEGDRFTFDNRVRYFCNKGYVLQGPLTRYCGELGFWEGDIPICEKIKCVVPALTENTVLIKPTSDRKYNPNEEAFFECTPGNQFYTSHKSVTCQRDGTWDLSIPSCDPQTCKIPPKIDHGSFSNANNAKEFAVGFIAHYACEFGYKFSENSLNPSGRITCLPSGEWEANSPECLIAECQEPSSITNGRYVMDRRTFLGQVRYTCDAGYDLSGINVLECYETGEWSGSFPECKPVRCSRPDDILHGSFDGNLFTYKERIKYSCILGYVLVGNASRECQQNASWSGSLPVCKPISCGKPDPIEFGSVIGRDFTLNNIVRYTCDNGYELIGSEDRMCRETGKWQSNAPTCQRKQCDNPPVVKNGFYAETEFYFQDSVYYQCEQGYYMEGSSNLTCTATKQWTPLPPKCLPIQCANPPSLEHANFLNLLNRSEFNIDDRIRYQCDEGYELSFNSLNPSGEIRCLQTGMWEANLPECLIISCPQPVPIVHGAYTADTAKYSYGSKLTFTCNGGYEIKGESVLTCKSDGNWSHPQPVCSAIECLAPEFVPNGRIDFKDLKLGSVIRYMCNEGYELFGLEVRRCLSNLSWSGDEPACEAVSCGLPPSLANGTMQYEAVTFQFSVRYKCNVGYILIGDKTRICSKDKVWSGSAPSCEIVQCDKPSKVISNGRMIGDDFYYQSTVSYLCDPGYYIDDARNNRTCQASGVWDNPIPVCIAVECPRLSIVNGFTSGFQTQFGAKLKVTCRPAHYLTGASERTCQQDGTWSGEESVCVKYACPTLSAPTNGQVFVQSDVASYVCLQGYLLNGPSVLNCQRNNTWHADPPSCDPILCADITTREFQNGTFNFTDITYGSTITYECSPGYRLVGERNLLCQVDGMWSEDIPVCQKIQCHQPYIPNFAKIIGSDFSFGSSVEYQCESGYRIVGISVSTCQADGSWTATSLSCKLIVCPQPEQSPNLIIIGTSYAYGNQLEYMCNKGFELEGPAVRNCTASGSWSGLNPTCVRRECPQPLPLEDGRFYGNNYKEGSRITYECNVGYELVGLDFRLCLSSMEWSEEPFCQKVQCPTPPLVQNGFYVGVNFSFGDSIEYKCNDGYEVIGDRKRTCLNVKEWSGVNPTCRKVLCGPPKVAAHVIFTLPDEQRDGAYESTANLSCVEGYMGRGNNIQKCQANGSWTESTFYCAAVTCPAFLDVNHGRISGKNNTFGSELEVICNDGYYILGKSRIRCEANGNWSHELPRCEKVRCVELGELSNAVKLYEGLAGDIGSVVTYQCNEGYRLQGSAKRMCEKTGRWSGSDPFCRLIICETPPYVSNARPFSAVTQYIYNSEVRYDCDTGYVLSKGDSKLICAGKGEWSGIVPMCSLVHCAEPTAIPNSKVIIPSYDYNSEAEYLCYLGYRLKGKATIKCEANGMWAGSPPTCVPIDCGAPPLVANSAILTTNQHTFNSVVTYVCEVGFRLIGQQSLSCIATGVWSGQTPVCEPISCGTPPKIDNAVYAGANFIYRSVVTYRCLEGFELLGGPLLTCAYDGAWVGDRPECIELSCGPPLVFPHSSTTMTKGAHVGSVAAFLCNDGYYLVGSASAKCLPDKRWAYEGDAPSCKPVDCLKPNQIKHGHSIFKNTTFDSVATYVCDKGYHKDGEGSLRCEANGQWKGAIPACKPVTCGLPPSADNVVVRGNQFNYADTVQYSCENGYTLSGPSSTTCMENGTWSEQSPNCTKVTCKVLTLPQDGITLNGNLSQQNQYGDRIVLGCSEGYDLIGSRELECMDSGVWSDELPTCQRQAEFLACDVDPHLPHVQSLPEIKYVGQTVSLQCDAGYQANGNMDSVCQENQTWSLPAGACLSTFRFADIRAFCGKPKLRDFVNVVRIEGASYFTGDQITFRCRAGIFPARSPPVVTCLEDGTWDGEIACGVTCKRPCRNGGICLGLNRCKCLPGYVGDICEKAICILPCLNGGECEAPYRCVCPHAYEGVRCQKAICNKPCAHEGRCVKPNKCQCSNGYSGAFCEHKRF